MDYSIPPWLVPKESFADSFGKGVQTGSQIARNFIQGRELADNEALMPLRAQAMQNQLEETALDIHTKQNMQADYLASKRALSDFSDKVARISDDDAWDDMSRMGDLADSIKSHPELLYNQSTAPFVKSAFQRFMDAKKWDYNFSQLGIRQDKLSEDARHNLAREGETQAYHEDLATNATTREEGKNFRFDERLTFQKQQEAFKERMAMTKPGQTDWDLKVKATNLEKDKIAARTLRDKILSTGTESQKMDARREYSREIRRINAENDSLFGEWRDRRKTQPQAAPADETQEAPRDRGREDISPMIAPDDPREGKIGVAKDGKRYRITNGVPVLVQ